MNWAVRSVVPTTASLAILLLGASGCRQDDQLAAREEINAQQVCFITRTDGAVEAIAHTGGCFSDTRVLESNLTATVTEEPPVVRLQPRLVVRRHEVADPDAAFALACGSEALVADLGVVPPQTYQVFVDERLVGSWAPDPGTGPGDGQQVCLEVNG